jgi:hypothetical protein
VVVFVVVLGAAGALVAVVVEGDDPFVANGVPPDPVTPGLVVVVVVLHAPRRRASGPQVEVVVEVVASVRSNDAFCAAMVDR